MSTAPDYLRFVDRLLRGGELDGQRILSPMTIKLMTSDALGARTALPLTPGELLMGVQGYTFGLGFTVRQGPGLAGVAGSEGEYLWAGAGGTFFWVDLKEKLAVVVMMQGTGCDPAVSPNGAEADDRIGHRALIVDSSFPRRREPSVVWT